MLLLFQLVVERLELLALVGVAQAVVRGEHVVDVLAEGHLGAESIHQVRRCVIVTVASCQVLQPNIAVTGVAFSLRVRELIEVWCIVLLGLSASSIPHRVSLKLVEATGNALDLWWQLKPTTNHNLVSIPLRRGWIRVSVHANMVLDANPKIGWGLLPQSLLVAHRRLAHGVVVDWAEIAIAHERHLVTHHVVAHLASTQVLCLILNYHLLEQVVLFILLDHWLLGGGAAWPIGSISCLALSFDIWIQILQVDLVAILVFEGVQAAIGALLEQELTQVGRWDEVVGLRVKVLRVRHLGSLSSVLLATSDGVRISSVHLAGIGMVWLLTHSNLTAMDILVFGLGLLHVASILVHRWLSLVRNVKIHHLALLHANLAWNDAAWGSLHVAFDGVLRLVLIVLPNFWACIQILHSRNHLTHLRHGSNLVDGWTVLVQGVLVVVGPHGGTRFGWLTSAAPFMPTLSRLLVRMLVRYHLLLQLLLLVGLYLFFNFRFSNFIEPRFG